MSLTGYVLLNVIRWYGVICLLSVVASSGVIAAKSGFTQYIILAAINGLSRSSICVFLITSEISAFPGYLGKYWPLWGPNSSLLATGVSEILLACTLLGAFKNQREGSEALGNKLFIFTMVSGAMACASGVLTCGVSRLYRDRRYGVTARMVRSRNRWKKDAAGKWMSRDFLPGSGLGDEESAPHITAPARTYSTRDPHPKRFGDARSQTTDESRSSIGGGTTSSSVTQPSARNRFPEMPADGYAITSGCASSVNSNLTGGCYPSDIVNSYLAL